MRTFVSYQISNHSKKLKIIIALLQIQKLYARA